MEIIAVFGSFLLWTNIYLVIYSMIYHLHRSAESSCRAVTVFHAFLVSGLSLTSILFLGRWPWDYLGLSNTELHTDTIVLSLGYFLFDFAWCVNKHTEGTVMLLHHVVSIFGFGYILYTGKNGCETTFVLGASEITNPLLQLRWFLIQNKLYSGAVERMVDWLFACLFCCLRLGVGSIFFIIFVFSPQIETIPRVGGTIFYIISVVFSIQTALYIHKKYFKNGRTK